MKHKLAVDRAVLFSAYPKPPGIIYPQVPESQYPYTPPPGLSSFPLHPSVSRSNVSATVKWMQNVHHAYAKRLVYQSDPLVRIHANAG